MKRKVTYEQAAALEKGRKVARANQRRSVEARLAAEREAADLAHASADHVHLWRNWEYSADYTHETRACACGATETRKVTL